jgi:hypothetical protein
LYSTKPRAVHTSKLRGISEHGSALLFIHHLAILPSALGSQSIDFDQFLCILVIRYICSGTLGWEDAVASWDWNKWALAPSSTYHLPRLSNPPPSEQMRVPHPPLSTSQGSVHAADIWLVIPNSTRRLMLGCKWKWPGSHPTWQVDKSQCLVLVIMALFHASISTPPHVAADPLGLSPLSSTQQRPLSRNSLEGLSAAFYTGRLSQ